MNILIIVLVISVCEACRSSIVKPTEDTTAKVNVQVHRTQPLPVPIPKHIIVREGARVTVAWDPINVKKDNPILGIKVRELLFLYTPKSLKMNKVSCMYGPHPLNSQIFIETVYVIDSTLIVLIKCQAYHKASVT